MKAAKVYKNYSISDAIKMFHVAVELQLSNGRISSAAKLYTGR